MHAPSAYWAVIALARHTKRLVRELVREWNDLEEGSVWELKVRGGDNVATLLYGHTAKSRDVLDRMAGAATIGDLVRGMRRGAYAIDDYSVLFHTLLMTCVHAQAARRDGAEATEAAQAETEAAEAAHCLLYTSPSPRD